MKRLAHSVLATTLVLTLCAGLAAPPAAAQDAPRQLPTFEKTTLDGKPLRTQDWRGSVVLLDFWATWCQPCIAAIPKLRKLSEDNADAPFQLVSISNDRKEEVIRGFLDKNDVPWAQLWDGRSQIARELGVLGLPTYVLFDHNGDEVYRVTGWAEHIERVLKQRVATAIEAAEAAQNDSVD